MTGVVVPLVARFIVALTGELVKVPISGDGTAIGFVIMDGHYGDNTVGDIQVVIWQMTP